MSTNIQQPPDISRLVGRTIRLRLVQEDDAAFILKLRVDARYNQYLSNVSSSVEEQRAWIKKYKSDESKSLQYYFIIERLDGGRCGTIRVYDIRNDSFCWGSWILDENKTRYAAVESAFLIYDFGFGLLHFRKSHFDVRKGNDKVISFHKKMGAVVIGEDDLNYYFTITEAAVEKARRALIGKIL